MEVHSIWGKKNGRAGSAIMANVTNSMLRQSKQQVACRVEGIWGRTVSRIFSPGRSTKLAVNLLLVSALRPAMVSPRPVAVPMPAPIPTAAPTPIPMAAPPQMPAPRAPAADAAPTAEAPAAATAGVKCCEQQGNTT